MKEPNIVLPNNRKIAERRLEQLKKRFKGDEKHFHYYKIFMDELIEKGYAKISGITAAEGKIWYIPHHGVYNVNKPNKVRVVFDCSSEFENTSLNKNLMSGPDLTNQLTGVLLRFREETVAFTADIEKMFYQVRVADSHRSMLRYLWWRDNDLNKEVIDHEMCVHVFGAASSPGCSNYALKRTAVDNCVTFGKDAETVLKRNFYVDDLLKSMPNGETAIDLLLQVIAMCRAGGFNLTKVVSNHQPLLNTLPEEKRKSVTSLDLVQEGNQEERALGIRWNLIKDKFGFRILLNCKVLTRRTILSVLCSIYDPLGFAAPFILEGRRVIQITCQHKLDWDEVVSHEVGERWKIWTTQLNNFQHIEVTRCFKSTIFEKIVDCNFHHFSDASEYGYGQVSYLRLVDENGRIHCSFIIGKSRVAPLKYVTIPRLELTTAVLSVKNVANDKTRNRLRYQQ